MSSSESIATPTRPTSPSGARVVGVVAELRRQVEGDREPGLAALEQVAVALRSTPRPRRSPRTAASSTAARGTCPDTAARERVLARRLELARRVVGRVDRLHLDARVGAPVAALRHATDRRGLRRGVATPACRPHARYGRHAAAAVAGQAERRSASRGEPRRFPCGGCRGRGAARCRDGRACDPVEKVEELVAGIIVRNSCRSTDPLVRNYRMQLVSVKRDPRRGTTESSMAI